MSESSIASQILQAIQDHGPASRSTLARLTGLSMSSVSMVTKTLLAKGVVEETGTVQQAMGRPSILLALRSDAAYFAGACVNRDGLVTVVSDLGGKVLGQRSAYLDGFDPAAVVSAVAGSVGDLLLEAKVPREALAGAGFAVSGLVDSATGVCLHSTVLGWENVAIGPMLNRALGIPVELENDANAVTIGERYFGGSAPSGDLVVLSVGHGIGAGLFLQERLYSGEFGIAGELGHCTVEPDGPRCRCGKRGCLEAISSVPAMLSAAGEAGLGAASLDDLEELVETRPEAKEILQRAGSALGLALSHVVNVLSPALVIVTGSGIRLGPTLQRSITESLERHSLPLFPHPPRLLFHHEDEGVWARGAAKLAAQAFIRRGGEFLGQAPSPTVPAATTGAGP